MYSKIIVDERVKKNGIDLWIDKLKMFIMIDRFASLLTLNVCDSRAIFLHISPHKKTTKIIEVFCYIVNGWPREQSIFTYQ